MKNNKLLKFTKIGYWKIIKILKICLYKLDHIVGYIGIVLTELCLLSYILYFFNRTFILIYWIDLFSVNGLILRAIFAVVGLILFGISYIRVFAKIADNFKPKFLVLPVILVFITYIGSQIYFKYEVRLNKEYKAGFDEGYNQGYGQAKTNDEEHKDETYYTGYYDGKEIGYTKGYADGKKESKENNSTALKQEHAKGYSEGYNVGVKENENKYNNGYIQGLKDGSIKYSVQESTTKPTTKPTKEVLNTDNETFSIGSTKEHVKSIMGTPTSVNVYEHMGEETWYYKLSSITFKDGVVKDYSNLSGNLKIK